MDRRQFGKLAVMGGTAAMLPGFASAQTGVDADGMRNLAANAKPISAEERRARVAKAGALMRANDIDVVLIEAGSSLVYFTGIHWWRSERLTGAVITREGEIAVVTPFFEEPSVRETLELDAQVLTWNEDEDPLALIGDWLGKRGLAKGKIGIEETVRYFAVDGLQHAMPDADLVSANPVVRGCRMIKSPAELALMQVANDITLAAYRHMYRKIEAGMTPADVGKLINGATVAMGGNPEFALVLLGEASAYPHGTGKPQAVREGEVVLLDCGCNVHGYQSDISRSFVFGEANEEQRLVWNRMRKGQQIAFEAAQVGTEAGKVDDAVRAYYETLGYGPGYQLPGTSHRTGHGIGLDGHEWVNFVRGNKTPLAPGMCFSNEPMIAIYGEFGIRLEDCLYMTQDEARFFSQQSPAIDKPFA